MDFQNIGCNLRSMPQQSFIRICTVMMAVEALSLVYYTKLNTGVNANVRADHNSNPYSNWGIFIVPKSLQINREATKHGGQSRTSLTRLRPLPALAPGARHRHRCDGGTVPTKKGFCQSRSKIPT